MISHQNTAKVLSFAFNWFELRGLHKSSQGHALYSQEAKTQKNIKPKQTNLHYHRSTQLLSRNGLIFFINSPCF